MHVVRVLAALVFGGLASIALAHLLADALRPIWGDQAPVRAVFGAPVVILFAAWIIVLLTRPVRQSADQPRLSPVRIEVTVNVDRAMALRDLSGISYRDVAERAAAGDAVPGLGAVALTPSMLTIQKGAEFHG